MDTIRDNQKGQECPLNVVLVEIGIIDVVFAILTSCMILFF